MSEDQNRNLNTALRDLADSGTPRPLDVGRAVADGRRGARRARFAVVGGTAAVVAIAGAIVSALPSGGSTSGAVSPAGPAPTSETAAAPSGAGQSTPAAVNAADPDLTHWQFDYLPSGMTQIGGSTSPDLSVSVTSAYSATGKFRLQLESQTREPTLGEPAGDNPTQWVPAEVAGSRQAFWAGYADGRIEHGGGELGSAARLYWQTARGDWLELTAVYTTDRADWKEQTLQTAAHVVKADQAVPMPITITGGFPADFQDRGTNLYLWDGDASVSIFRTVGKSEIYILAFPTGKAKYWVDNKIGGTLDGAPRQAVHTCKDSNGLTVCVAVDQGEPASLTAIGGRQGLLDRITSLGTDRSKWTTDVFR